MQWLFYQMIDVVSKMVVRGWDCWMLCMESTLAFRFVVPCCWFREGGRKRCDPPVGSMSWLKVKFWQYVGLEGWCVGDAAEKYSSNR